MFEQPPDGALWVREWHAVGCAIWFEEAVALEQARHRLRPE